MLDAIEAGDAEACRTLIQAHITCRMEEIARVVDAGMVRLYSR
jgi:DNA-binding GntR family transcriptional regulator